MKKFLRILGILSALLLLVGYFAFSTYFFSPFEGSLGVDVAGLVPRRVQFFAAKARLDTVFDPFPRIAAAEAFSADETWSSILSSPEYNDLIGSLGVNEALTQIDDITGQLPLGASKAGLLEIFGGQEFALAGELKGAELADADWAIYGSVNWAGKLAIEALRHPSISNLKGQGFTSVQKENYVTISGGGLDRPLHIGRLLDVGIIGTGEALVADVFELEARQFQDSMLLRDEYRAFVQSERRSPDGDDLELFCNLRGVCEELGIEAAWPDQKADTFLPKFAGQFFQLNSLNQVSGFLDIDEGVRMDLHASLSSELISSTMKKHYAIEGISGDDLMKNAARMAPADSSVFAYFNGDVGDLLDEASRAMEPAMRQAIEDQFRSTGRYKRLSELIEQLDKAFKDRCVLIMRTNDYPDDPDGPPHNDEPVFASALVFWLQGRAGEESIIQLRELIGQQGRQFGLKGREKDEVGYYKNIVDGYEIREFWSELIPGTGVVATVNAAGMCIISNSFDMTGHLLKTFSRGGREYPRLSERPEFRALVNDSLMTADLVAWVDPRELTETLELRVPQAARDSVQIDWPSERAKAQTELLREEFGGRPAQQLTADEAARLKQRVNVLLDEVERERVSVQGGETLARLKRQVGWLKGARAFLLEASFASREIDLSLRLVAPLEE
jgi:hypothetical protein